MTARSTTDPQLDRPLTSVDEAAAFIAATALRDGPIASVGVELEAHLVLLGDPGRRPAGDAVQRLHDELPAMPAGSPLTEEPGGQIELSTPPAPSLAEAVAATRSDRVALRAALADRGYGSASLGADPARAPVVVNPAPRYAAMQRHWAAVGCAEPGRGMMACTAALQVNLDAGPATGWRDRVEHLHRLGPALLAMSACSPVLGRRESGWASMRQQMWAGIDAGRTAQLPAGDPVEAWVRYALAAPVMLVRDHATSDAEPVPSRVGFSSWVTGAAKLIRRPTVRDLQYHLTTLYPAVRPRGYLEIRYLDAVPDRWWPGLAAIVGVLADDPVAAARADEICEPVADAWATAARDGLADDAVWAAARALAPLAADRAPAELRPEATAYAELVARRRTPGDDLRDLIHAVGPVEALRREAA